MSTLAIIPARSGSQGLVDKNIRPFCGLPLLAHSVRFAQACPSIDAIAVSSDSLEYGLQAAMYDIGPKPLYFFKRPDELSQNDTPIWKVITHVLDNAEQTLSAEFRFMVLLEPTSPLRRVQDFEEAIKRLHKTPKADGIMAVVKARFNPVWNSFYDRGGYLVYIFPEGKQLTRRQEAPEIYHHSGSFYIWRSEFVRVPRGNYTEGRYIFQETPANMAFSIDTLDEFEDAENLVKAGIIKLEWPVP